MSDRNYSKTRLIADYLSLHGWVFLVAIVVVVLFVSAFIGYGIFQRLEKEKLSWPVIEATVFESRHREFISGSATKGARTAQVESQLNLIYHVDGKDWRTSKAITFPKALLPEYESILNSGSVIPIHVSPDDPEDVYFEDMVTWTQSLKDFAQSRQ